ncbi:MAG: hypothetical protein V4710_15560 [Verrucomicrobiota bacterium]
MKIWWNQFRWRLAISIIPMRMRWSIVHAIIAQAELEEEHGNDERAMALYDHAISVISK